MKRILSGALAAALLLGTTGIAAAAPYRNRDSYRGAAYGQSRNDHRYDHDRRGKWREGQRIDRREWSRWERADWRRNHLRRPPRGYEWRRADDGRFVEIAIATGIILAIVAASN